MKTSAKTFFGGILAGLFIGLAGTVYLAMASKGNPAFGAVLFGFGLMTILCYGFKLFTGAIGYLVNQGKNAPAYCWQLVLIWLGNLVGTFLVGTAIRATRSFNAGFSTTVQGICQAKLDDSPLSILILAFFCGILMYLAVESYKRTDLHAVFRIAAVFLCVTVFILSGFEHCIANMYYFSVAGLWSIATLKSILLMTLGNSLGGFLIPLADMVRKD